MKWSAVLMMIRALLPWGSARDGVRCAEEEERAVKREKAFREYVGRLRLEAERGESPAQRTLGLMYLMGIGVPRYGREPDVWYRFCAEQGNAEAQFRMGLAYSFGIGDIRSDPVKAHSWFARASAQGHRGAAKLLSTNKRDRL